MCELFRAHEKGFASGIVPAARLLFELFATLQYADLATDLVSESAPHAADRVRVLDLNFCSEFALPFGPYGNVAIAAELSFFHVGVTHFAVDQDLFQRR